MEKDKIDYIINYHSDLMTEIEMNALKHWRHSFKLDHSEFKTTQKKENFKSVYYKIGWLTKDIETLNLLRDGLETFKKRVATRVNNEEKI